MGLFTRDYNRPGKGVDKNEPQKNAFFHFFELFGRKFFRLVTFNLFYFACMLPLIIAFYNLFYSWLYQIAGLGGDDVVVLPVLVDFLHIVYNFVPEFLHMPLVIVSLILYGPITMGYTYVLRNFVREEHAWTSDFFTRAFSNFKQGLFFGILDAIVLVIFYINWNYGALMGDEDVGIFAIIIRVLTTVVFVYYLFMRNYNYQQAVTVNLGAGQILKNSALFGIIGLWRNIIAVVLSILVCLISLLLNPFVELLLVPFIMFSLAGFISVYCTYPIVDKYIVKPAMEAEGKNNDRIGLDDLPPAVLPPELGGPGAGAHTEYLDKNDEGGATEPTVDTPADEPADDAK